MRGALYFFGVCLLAFALSIAYAVHAITSGVENAKYVISQVPVATAQIREAVGDLDRVTQKASAASAAIREQSAAAAERLRAAIPSALPEAASTIGKAGATMIRGFAHGIADSDGQEVPAEAQK
jgi:hypothetical protein